MVVLIIKLCKYQEGTFVQVENNYCNSSTTVSSLINPLVIRNSQVKLDSSCNLQCLLFSSKLKCTRNTLKVEL